MLKEKEHHILKSKCKIKKLNQKRFYLIGLLIYRYIFNILTISKTRASYIFIQLLKGFIVIYVNYKSLSKLSSIN